MRRIAPLVVALAVFAAACASSTTATLTPTTSDSPVAADTTTATETSSAESIPPAQQSLSADEVASAVDEILALPTGARDARIGALSSDYERQLAALSGLQDALGGSDAAAAELTAAWEGLIQQIRQIAEQPILLGHHRSAAQADGPNLGEGLFGTVITVGLLGDAAVKASNTAEPGAATESGGTKETMVSGSLNEASVDVDLTYKGERVTTALKVHIKVLPCPDANGHFTAEATAEISATAGSVGQTGTLMVTIEGTVDDDANLASLTYEYRMQWADFAGGKGKFADVSGGNLVAPTLNRTGGAVTPEFEQATTSTGQLFGQILASQLATLAETGWKSGRCVSIVTTAAPGPTGMQPGSSSAVTAAPRSKVDGAPTGGTVTATLTAGGKAVSPAATKVAADASFTYSAPDEKDQGGTVHLEARSKRGIGLADIVFDTKGGSYTATYDGDGISIRGTIADLAKPFEASGTFTGGEVTFRFKPTDAGSGSLAHDDPCGPGCVAKGSGTYTIIDPGAGDGTLTLKMVFSTCVTVTVEGRSSKQCDDKVHDVLLTPA